MLKDVNKNSRKKIIDRFIHSIEVNKKRLEAIIFYTTLWGYRSRK